MYLKGTLNIGLKYGKYSDDIEICGYYDAHFAKDFEFRRFTFAYILTICGCCVS